MILLFARRQLHLLCPQFPYEYNILKERAIIFIPTYTIGFRETKSVFLLDHFLDQFINHENADLIHFKLSMEFLTNSYIVRVPLPRV